MIDRQTIRRHGIVLVAEFLINYIKTVVLLQGPFLKPGDSLR